MNLYCTLDRWKACKGVKVSWIFERIAPRYGKSFKDPGFNGSHIPPYFFRRKDYIFAPTAHHLTACLQFHGDRNLRSPIAASQSLNGPCATNYPETCTWKIS